jgi:type IV pilus assembly protein PilV
VLIEVLISVLLFSVGILGLVSLQAKMTHAQTEAKARATASYLAAELTGLMWADIANLAQYQSSGCASYAQCKSWSDKLSNALTSSSSTVTLSTSTGDVSITITWQLPGGSAHQYQTVTTIKGRV